MENSGRTLAINLAPICHAFVYIYRNDSASALVVTTLIRTYGNATLCTNV